MDAYTTTGCLKVGSAKAVKKKGRAKGMHASDVRQYQRFYGDGYDTARDCMNVEYGCVRPGRKGRWAAVMELFCNFYITGKVKGQRQTKTKPKNRCSFNIKNIKQECIRNVVKTAL